MGKHNTKNSRRRGGRDTGPPVTPEVLLECLRGPSSILRVLVVLLSAPGIGRRGGGSVCMSALVAVVVGLASHRGWLIP